MPNMRTIVRKGSIVALRSEKYGNTEVPIYRSTLIHQYVHLDIDHDVEFATTKESAQRYLKAVAEAAAIGLSHEVKGQAIHTFVILRSGFAPSMELAEELRQHVATHMGPIARPEDVKFLDKLPKTRSGKIMRRVLKARAQGLPEGDISTLEE